MARSAKKILSKEQKDHRMVLAGLMLGILLASLDQTIVGTSLFRIVQEVGGADRFTGVVTAYLLSSTIFIPLAGKMGDRVGRRTVFLVSMGVFLVGSMLCGIAQNIDELILFRFLQGVGAGGLFPVAFAAVADMYPPSERGKIQGAMGAVFGLSAVIGPLLGGYLVDNVGWRWVFYVNLPVGIPAMLITFNHFARAQPQKDKPLDVAGALAMTAALSGI
ncbi:MAG: MFS transporter, partial [Halobacteriales archaeon]|nr:MFS transporter [Halobacteriales archaeon]